jgi:hypothetical protein
MEPIVFLIDLDGTIQGNVVPQIIEYELIRKLNTIIPTNKIKYNTKKLEIDFQNGLLRPHFKEALLSIKKIHPHVEFFIYTASSDQWAHFLIPKLNRMLFRKDEVINKPYFTRKHCSLTGKKSISKLIPLIKKSLQTKYPNAKYDNVYLIDNNFVLENEEMNRLIYCPTYNYTVMNCPMRNFKEDHLNKYYNEISKQLFSVSTKIKFELLKIYYDKAFKEYEYTERNNKQYKNDTYWKDLAKVVNSGKLNNKNNINTTIKNMKSLHKKTI